MKKSLFILSFLWLGMFAFSQSPQGLLRSFGGINYQTVIRDGDGQLLANTAVTLRMTIYENAPDGAAVYRETHAKTTNAFGLVNLVIGQGTPVIGSFDMINWGKAAFYLETAVDLTGGGQFQVMGVTQFVSVPYSLFSVQAGGILSMTNQERDALQNPPVGMQIYNSTTNCLNYFSGYDWYETCGNLIVNQPPDMPMAITPPDGATGLVFDFNLEWLCSDPENDPMMYELYFGNTNPPPFFQSGIDTTVYFVSQLEFGMPYFWKIVAFDNHGNMTVGPVWNFQTMMCLPPTPWAGNDATICENEIYQIEGATGGPEIYLMEWSTDGDGTFSNPEIANPQYFPGQLDVSNGFVELTLTSFANEPCPPFPGSDALMLHFQLNPYAWAGSDMTVCEGFPVYISEAVVQNVSDVMWTTTGSGTFNNPYQFFPIYYPSAGDLQAGLVNLQLIVDALPPCMGNYADILQVTLAPIPTANAGPDQLNLIGNSTTLQGNTPPAEAYGTWSITSGIGGVIAQPNNPNSLFTALTGNTYTLKWTVMVYDLCSSDDDVQINFGCFPQVAANAGFDQTVCFGVEIQLDGTASNYSNINWATYDGSGGFPDNSIEDAVYWPSYFDYLMGCVHLTLEAMPIGPCTVSAIDTMLLCFYTQPTANAGPDQLNLAGTTATLAGSTPPSSGYGQWSIQSGTGGSIAQPGSPISTFTGVAGNSYALKWMVYDQNGCYAEDYVTISFASGFVCGTSTVTDVDGNAYNTVQVGSQCWMKQNLKTTKYRNGTAITYPGSNNTTWQNNTTGAYAWYNNDIANKTTYGALYNWYAVVNTNNLCPTGWHVPTDAQWTALTDYVSSQTAYRCNSTATYIAKSLAATTNWTTYTGTCTIGNNLAANNATGFTGLPGGYRYASGSFNLIGYYGYFWSSSEFSTTYAWSRNLDYSIADVGRYNSTKGYGFSVRCVRD